MLEFELASRTMSPEGLRRGYAKTRRIKWVSLAKHVNIRLWSVFCSLSSRAAVMLWLGLYRDIPFRLEQKTA